MMKVFLIAAGLLFPAVASAQGIPFWGSTNVPAAPVYTPQAVTFPTSADYLQYLSPSFPSDGDSITMAVTFVTPESLPGALAHVYALQNRIQIRKDSPSNKLTIDVRNPSNTVIYLKTSTAALATSTKYCLLFSARFDETPVAHFYLNGSDAADTGGTDPTASATIDFTQSGGEGLGAYTAGGNHFTGLKLGAFWLGQQYVNFSIPANVSAFCDGANPVYWGADGSTPTGVQPGRVNYWPSSGGRLVGAGSLSPTHDFTEAGSPTYGDW